MKSNVYFLLTAFMSIIIFSCGKTKKSQPESDVKTLRQTTDSLLVALNSKDAERFISFYDLHAQFISPETGMHYGKDDIRKTYSSGFALPGFWISGIIQDVQISKSGDIGLTLVPWDSYYIPESGEKVERKGINLLVWEKQENGSWKVIIDKP